MPLTAPFALNLWRWQQGGMLVPSQQTSNVSAAGETRGRKESRIIRPSCLPSSDSRSLSLDLFVHFLPTYSLDLGAGGGFGDGGEFSGCAVKSEKEI